LVVVGFVEETAVFFIHGCGLKWKNVSQSLNGLFDNHLILCATATKIDENQQ